MSTKQSMGHGDFAANPSQGPHFKAQPLHQGFQISVTDVRRVPIEPAVRIKAVS